LSCKVSAGTRNPKFVTRSKFMNCQTCQSDLEDLLYGELDRAWKMTLHEHLSVCVECREQYAALEREQEIFAQFYEQNALEPTDDLWQAIHERIKPESAPSHSVPSGWTTKLRHWLAPMLAPAMLQQAGFAAILVLVSVGLTALYFSTRKTEQQQVAVPKITPTPSSTATPVVAPQPTPEPRLPAPDLRASAKPQVTAPRVETKQTARPKLSEEEALMQQIAKASREYQGAIRLLERTIAKRKTQLDESTVRQFEGSLAMIDASIASSREALRAHPNDPAAARFLLSAYSKKVELMQEIAMR
jgi:anti-sigma factor RsiW